MLQPSPGAHGKLYPTQEATRIAAWSSTTAPLKQCPEKYRADEWFSELGAFRSGHSVRPEQLASAQEPSIVFIFLLMGILFARAAEGLQERPSPWTTVKPRDRPHLHARPADASSQTVNLFPECSGDGWGTLCGLNKQTWPLTTLSLGMVQHRCQEDPGTFIIYPLGSF